MREALGILTIALAMVLGSTLGGFYLGRREGRIQGMKAILEVSQILSTGILTEVKVTPAAYKNTQYIIKKFKELSALQ